MTTQGRELGRDEQVEVRSDMGELSLADQILAGEPYAIGFGGQGASWFAPLAELIRGAGLEGHARWLLAEAAALVRPVADELSVARPYGFEPLAWMEWEEAPEESMVLPPAVSGPGIFFAQALALHALTALGLDWRGNRPVGFAGHSLGVLAAAAAEQGGEQDAQFLALGQIIAAAASLVGRRNGLIGSDQAPTLVSVRNVDPEAMRGLLAEFHAIHNHPGDPVLALRNGRRSVALSGNPLRLAAFQAYAKGVSEKQTTERKKKLRGGSVFAPLFEPVHATVGFHHPHLAPAVDLVGDWAARCGLDVELGRSFAQQILVEPVDWVRQVEGLLDAGVRWILDAGPGDMLARLTAPVVRGQGVGLVSIATRAGQRALFTPGEAPSLPKRWSDFAPELVRLPDGKLAAQTAFTKLTGRSPMLLAGMTPTTVDPGIVAAAANAGHWAELAGGGQVTEAIFAKHVAELGELLEPGRAAQFNAMFLDPYLWKLHVGGKRLVPKARAAGAPFDGLVITAGIPDLPEALELVEELRQAGFSSVAFKPGTVDQIKSVVRIAKEVGGGQKIIAHIEGGRAGGHHSWEDLDDLLLETYSDLRKQSNLVVCVGGGIGTAERAAEYLTGEWSERLGYPRMPVDGILVGTAAMATLEATTSPDVKRLLVETAGASEWIPAGGESGGMASGRSQLGADIHEIDNAASQCGRLLDEVAGDEEAVAERKDEIVAALNKTAKPYFGEVAAMTYREWLERYVKLSGAPWLDVTWQERFLAMARRTEARLADADEGEIPTLFPDLDSVADGQGAIARLAKTYSDFGQTVLHPADVAFFIALCRRAGKPVCFVPVVDKDVRRWWRSDSLWQAHDPRYSADQVCVIPGPVAVAGITRADEPVGELLDRFERATVDKLVAAGLTPKNVPARRETAFSGSLGVFLAAPDVLWAGRLVTNPVHRLGDLEAWQQVEPHLLGHRVTGATLTRTEADRITLSIPVNGTWLALRFTVPASAATGGAPVFADADAANAMTGLLQVLAGGELPPTAPSETSAVAARITVPWSPNLPADHAGVTAVTLPKPLQPATIPYLGKVVPDVLVGLSWPAVFAVLGSARTEEGKGVVEGLLDLVHLDHAVRLAGEIPSWETAFGIDARLVGVADTGLGRVVEVEVAIADEASGKPVAWLVERFAIRGRVGEGEPSDPVRAGGEIPEPAVDTARAKRREATIVAPADLTAFAQVSGDHNPIHTSLTAAKLAGLPMPIVHGMWLSSAAQQVVAAVDMRDGQPAPRRIVGWTSRFLGMVYPDSRVTVRVDRVGVAGGGELLEVSCRVDGELVMAASARLAPPKTVYAFPGQGVQTKGMGLAARGRSKAARKVWDEADAFTKERLGFSILGVVRDNPTWIVVDGVRYDHPDGVLHLTQFTQVAMAVTALAQVAELKETGAYVPDAFLAGHSVGEYNAIASIAGTFSPTAVLAVVYQRGMTMNNFLPRDEQGRSNYQMAAIRPVHLGLADDEVFAWVEELAARAGEFLQIVNYNLRGTQYAIAGTVRGIEILERECARLQEEVGGKASFIRVPGIDVPFHSTLLREGVPEFRKVLQGLIPEEVDPSVIVGKYIPNLVARVFSLDREFVESVAAEVPSEPLREVLRDWAIWSAQPRRLASRLVVELLAWQFASPVRWIETQDLLFSPVLAGGLQVERFVEIGIGSAPTVANMARNTLRLDLFAGARVEVFNVERDWAATTSTDEGVLDEEDETEGQTAEAIPASPGLAPAAPVSVPAPAALSGGPRPDDVPFTAADAATALIALSVKVRVDQLAPADSIESLCEGASSRRNQLLLDLGAELNLGAIDGAAEADLPSLKGTVVKLARTYKPFGPVLADAVNDQLRKVLGPTGKRSSHVIERVKSVWELGQGWADHVLIAIALGTREGSSVRGEALGGLGVPGSAAEVDALVDAAVAQVGAANGVAVALPSKGGSGGGTVDVAALAELTEHITGPDGVLAATARFVLNQLGHTAEPAAQAETVLGSSLDQELADLVSAELGQDWVRAVAPVFDEGKAVLLDDRWASAREDLARTWTAFGQRSAALLSQERFAGAGEAVARQADWWAGKAETEGKTDLAKAYRSYALAARDTAPGAWSHETALVTGAGKGSIATAVVAELLAGGATVVATSSSLNEERLAFYRALYAEHARSGAALWVVPANMASYQDVDALVEWVAGEQTVSLGGKPKLVKPALNPTLLFPFAAPRVLGDLADAGPRAELEMKVLLWAAQRLIGALAAKAGEFDLGSRLHVVLPGSPNRGLFGGDGAYGESKAALDALVSRWRAERSWTRRVTLAHAVIGWVRGTGLMGGNDAVVAAVEQQGVRTFSTQEMAAELLGLCTPEARALAGTDPLSADLTGGLAGVRLDMAALAEEAARSGGLAAGRNDSAEQQSASLIPALPSPPRPVEAVDCQWPALSLDLKDLVVIVGAGEVGPYGSSRTRFEVEVTGDLSAAGVLELAWTTGLVSWQRDPEPGWYDAETGELVPEEEIASRYREKVLAHSGIRHFTPQTLQAGANGQRPLLAEVFLTEDLTFVVTSEAEARAFREADPEHTVIAPVADSSDWTVTRKEGTQIRVPREVKMTRTAGGQVPDGFDPTVWGVPADMIAVVDRLALWNLVATVDAFVSSGFSPAELMAAVHPTLVANVQGTGMGGMTSLRKMYYDFLLQGSPDQNDILQETLPNITLDHVVQSYVGSYGAMVHPVGACATTAVSIEEGVDKITLGKALFAVAGGYDDISLEEVLGFAEMNATADIAALEAKGIGTKRVSRPGDRRRAGFVDAQGGGTILLARGDVALELGLPVLGVVGYAQSFGDGVHTSIPAPGLGALAAGLGGTDSRLARALAKFGLASDDVAVVSKHDTSTLANDPNEANLHEKLAAAIGRSEGAPLFVISQKSLTGHSKGGAAAFQTIGLCQVLASGQIPANRSLDCVDDAMAEHEHLVWLKEPLAFDGSFPLKAGVVTSLGFGHVSGMILVVHPAAFLAALSDEGQRQAYAERARARRVAGMRRLQEAMCGGEAAYARPADRRLEGESHAAQERSESALLLDGSYRLDSSGRYCPRSSS